ncbi:MAG: MarR family winged helix-turn-helix transcriptional regulator [Alphaproteobacteria bacterium]|jgi:DNA-binding MarR family transcriptional regulator|nr:MarR family winged helix-turn-helix transcriptional regulator [Alphaproteobacteria bacterium]|tara:strand:+ start:932 stop:1465 length:534 start_codon:yes stop_codon:yes gene_type:complete
MTSPKGKRAVSAAAKGGEAPEGPSQENPGAAFHYRPGQSMGYLLRDCYRSLAKSLEVRIARHGVKMGQWFLLRELWEEDGLTQRELSERVGIMEPTTVVAIRGMVKDGVVTRERDTKDRRKLRIHLTAKGRRLKNKLLPFASEVNAIATRHMSEDEIRQFRELMNRMKRNMAEAEPG